MAPPTFRVGDAARTFGDELRALHPLDRAQGRALSAMALCRTAALGGHLEVCDRCGVELPAYNSCRNRHCASCQGAAATEWVERRMERILPVPHFHAVFTLPAGLRELFGEAHNRELLYDLLLRASARTFAVLGRKKLGARFGVTAVLHTWNQDLLFHPHVHGIVTAGGLTREDTWKATPTGYLLPVRWMSAFFRGAFLRDLRALHASGELTLHGALAEPGAFRALVRALYKERWVTYVKRPFEGTEGVFQYLGRYTHRVGISDSRLLDVNAETVTFKRRGQEPATLPGVEFLRRLMLHVLPPGFRKIRHYGLYAPAAVNTTLERARALLPAASPRPPREEPPPKPEDRPPRPCPICRAGFLHTVLLARRPIARAVPAEPPLDTS